MSSSRNSRRKQVVSNEENSNIKPTLWSEEDDVSLLKGMTDYELFKKSSPYDDMGKFLDFVKPSLHFDVQRKQLTNRLWKLRNRYHKSSFDFSKPHHAKLFELSKSIKSWGQNVEEDDNVVDDDVDVSKLSKVVENEKKGKFVASDDDVHVKGLKVKKKRKVLSKDAQNVNHEVDNVVVDRSSKVAEKGKKEKSVTGDGRNGTEDYVALDDDVGVNQGLKVVKKKRKLVTTGGQNVEVVNKCSKVGKNKKKGKVVICNGQNDKENDVDARKSEKIVNDTNKGNAITHDDQSVEEDIVVVADELDGDGSKSAQVVKDSKNAEEYHAVIGNSDQVVKKKGEVVIGNGQSGEEVNAVAHDVAREVGRKDSNDLTSMYPQLSNMLEFETLSRMPQQIRKKCVIDTIYAMGTEKANELEEELLDVRLKEMELNAKKLDLASKHINMILEAMHR